MKKILWALALCACFLNDPVYAAYEATGKAEDTAEADAMILVPSGTVRRDTAASSAGTTGDHATLNTDATGRVWANTELPDAAALADATANPTITGVAAYMMCFNGASWDRCLTGPTDTDDGTVAGSQVPTLTLNLNYVHDGTNWVRKRLSTGIEDAAETAGGALNMMGTVRRDTAASSAGTDGDNATANTDGLGRVWVRLGGPCSDHARITSAAISQSTAATNEIVALNGSDLIYVCSYKIVTTAANSLKWVRGTGTACATGTTDIEGAQPYGANSGITESGGGSPLFVVTAGNALCLSSSVATAHGGRISYVRTAAP